MKYTGRKSISKFIDQVIENIDNELLIIRYLKTKIKIWNRLFLFRWYGLSGIDNFYSDDMDEVEFFSDN